MPLTCQMCFCHITIVRLLKLNVLTETTGKWLNPFFFPLAFDLISSRVNRISHFDRHGQIQLGLSRLMLDWYWLTYCVITYCILGFKNSRTYHTDVLTELYVFCCLMTTRLRILACGWQVINTMASHSWTTQILTQGHVSDSTCLVWFA